MTFDSEYDAFKAYAESYPDGTVLLVDTYDVLKSGVPNAIRTAREVLEPMGKKLIGIRLVPEILPICPRRQGRCWMKQGFRTV